MNFQVSIHFVHNTQLSKNHVKQNPPLLERYLETNVVLADYDLALIGCVCIAILVKRSVVSLLIGFYYCILLIFQAASTWEKQCSNKREQN